MTPPSHCSFCAKSEHEVGELIAGPAALICNECIALCNDVIASNRIKKAVADHFARRDERDADKAAVVAI